MRKSQQTKTMLILTNNKQDTVYKDKIVLAVAEPKDKSLLEQYKQQLLNNGYEDNYIIEERKLNSFDYCIRYKGLHLEKYDDSLYPAKNICCAKLAHDIKLSRLETTYTELEYLKLLKEDKKIRKTYDEVIKDIQNEIKECKNKKLKIKMI